MKSLQYNAIMPKIAIENLSLFDPSDLVSLTNKDLDAVRCTLMDSPYREELLAIPKEKIDAEVLEMVLLNNQIRTYEELTRFSSGNIRKLLVAILSKFEVSNIKTMLRAAKAQTNVDQAMKNIIPTKELDKERCRAILTVSKTVDDVVNSLTDLEYGVIMKKVLNKHHEMRDITPLEVALDKAVYQQILQATDDLDGSDRKIARDILGIEIDATNIKIILKCKALAVSQERTKEYLMPGVLITEEILNEAIKARTTRSAIEVLLMYVRKRNQAYKSIFSRLLKESDAPVQQLEAILDKAAFETCQHMLKKYLRYYNIGFVLAFLTFKEIEIRNLRSIINGLQRNVPPNVIRKLLMFNE